MAELHRLFRVLNQQGGSDLHLMAGRPAVIRVHGDVRAIEGEPIYTNERLSAMMSEVTTVQQWDEFQRTNDIDFAVALTDVGRFRANYFRQHHGVGCVFRLIPNTVVPFASLGLPPIVSTLADFQSGLILVTGPTGSGKSTTLAAIIDLINEKYAKHIVTIEDPVEFVHRNKRSVLSQREVGKHTDSFDAALRGAIRQDADVVLVGEMRDLETISLAINAASMGILVFGTLHTSGAAKTIDRIIDAFPANEQPQARNTLAESLAAIVSQILLPKIGGGRIAVHEILTRTTALPGVIREGKMSLLNQLIASNKRFGMQFMDDALAAKVEEGVIAGADAFMKAHDKARFQKFADETHAAS